MSAGAETIEAQKWARATLAAGTALMAAVTGIYDDMAPRNAQTPFVSIGVHDASDWNALRGTRQAVDIDLTIKAVTSGNTYQGAADVMALADPLLIAPGTVLSGTVPVLLVLGCYRVTSVQYSEIDDGQRFNHVGGVYRLAVQTP